VTGFGRGGVLAWWPRKGGCAAPYFAVPALPKHIQVVDYMTSCFWNLPCTFFLVPAAAAAAARPCCRHQCCQQIRCYREQACGLTRVQNAGTTGANDSVDFWDFPGRFS